MSTVTLAYEQYAGPERAVPLIILHGFMASARNWRSAAQRLSEHFCVYVLDMRNHGLSPNVGELDYAAMCGDVLAFMAAHDLERAHVLGHSMGGKIAMCMALQHPQRLLSLVIADIAPVAYQHCFDHTLNALRQLPLDSLSNRKQAEQWLADFIPELSYRQFLLQNLQFSEGRYFWRIDLDIAQASGHHIVGFPDYGDQQFLGDCLFLAGQRSTYVQPSAVYRYFPRAEIVVIDNAGHWLYVEAPDAFLRIVTDWLCAQA